MNRIEPMRPAALRNRRGNVMILVSAITLGIIIAVILFALDYNQFLGASHQHLSAVEAAGLRAADDLSRIVIKEKNYGFIALTDYPPIGAGTVAPDGKPLPVTGINTIVGTARLDCIIANKVGNPVLIALAKKEAQHAKEAQQTLQKCLVNAVSKEEESTPTGALPIAGVSGDPTGADWYTDMNGAVVNPFGGAKKVYMSNLASMSNGGKYAVNTFKLRLGYLSQGGGTVTQIPRPEDMGQVSSNQKQGKFYKAFVNIPVSGGASGDFYFAGLSAQPALVDARQCKVPGNGGPGDYDAEPRFCSAVEVKAEHEFMKAEGVTKQLFTTIACAEPVAVPDSNPPGILGIAFPDGFVPGINTISDLLDSGKLPGTGHAGPIVAGDWPIDPGSLIGGGGVDVGSGTTTTPKASDMFALAFFNWLKNAKTRPDVDAVDKLADQDLHTLISGSIISVTISSNTLPAQPEFAPPRFDLMQPAFAGGPNPPSDENLVLTGVLSKLEADARWDALRMNTQAGKEAYAKVANFTSISASLPDNAAKILIDDSGAMHSATGEDLSDQDLKNFWTAVQDSLTAAYATKAATTIPLAVGNVGNAKKNADETIKACNQLIKDQASVTEDGIHSNGDGSYTVGGAKMYPHKIPAVPTNLALPSNSTGNAECNKPWDDGGFKFYDQSKAKPADTETPKLFRCCILEFDKDGYVVATSMPSIPFQGLPVADGGEFGVSFDAIPDAPGNVVWTATYRSNANDWGKGKHGGTPLPGTPIDWCTTSTYGFNESLAEVKLKGPIVLGVQVDSYGGDKQPPPYPNTSKSCGSHGSHGGKKQQGLQNGCGPRSNMQGNGKYEDDIQGFPWGFKYGAKSGADWTTADVKYQFPEGNNELKDCTLPCGKSLAPVRDLLNSGGGGLPSSGSNVCLGLPCGLFATLTTKSGTPIAVRSNYLCGGFVGDFQLRSPFKLMDVFPGTSNGLALIPGGNGNIHVAGISLPVNLPGLNLDVTVGSSNNGVMAAGDADATTGLPKPPTNLN